jgi:integrase
MRGRKAAALRADVASGGEPFDDYVKRWFAEREERGLSSIPTDRSRIRVHVSPTLGDKRMCELTSVDLRAVCGSKVEALRVLTVNPCANVRDPVRGAPKAKQWLRPNEIIQLVGCFEVPLRWRRLYALASYLYLRPGELAALEWADVHLAEGYVAIHQAFNLESGKLKATKTGHSRKVPIRPALLPLLGAMHDDLAATLREHLERAEVDRADLFADRPTTKKIVFYDLRASGITAEVLDGTEPLRIQQRAGHTNFSTTQGYIREAEALGESVGVPFGPLPESLLSAVDDPQMCEAPLAESSGDSSNGTLRVGDPACFLPNRVASPRGLAQ